MALEINAEELVKHIDHSFKEMQRFKFIEEDRFAIFECNGIQVQVVLTRDRHEKLEEVLKDLVSIKS